jgi:hypothetical protein
VVECKNASPLVGLRRDPVGGAAARGASFLQVRTKVFKTKVHFHVSLGKRENLVLAIRERFRATLVRKANVSTYIFYEFISSVFDVALLSENLSFCSSAKYL